MGHDTFAYRHKTQEQVAYLRGGWHIFKALGVKEDANLERMTITSSTELLDGMEKYSQEYMNRIITYNKGRDPHFAPTPALESWYFQRMFLERVRDALIEYGKVDILFSY